jgi:catalase
MKGFMSFPEPVEEHKVRGKPEKFAEHYNQAALFWASQSDVEKQHIIRAYRFELTKVQTVAVRRRVVAQLRNVAEELAQAVAQGLGMDDLPEALPEALRRRPKPEVKTSGALSLFARPGSAGVRTRRIAILVAHGVDGEAATALHAALAAQGAVPRFVGVKLGRVQSTTGEPIEVEISMETAPPVLWDAMAIPDGEGAAQALSQSGHAIEFLKDQYRHCKTILVVGAAAALLGEAGIPAALPTGDADPGLLKRAAGDVDGAAAVFIEALAKHRHWQRESDPPTI